jgi:predicted ATPase
MSVGARKDKVKAITVTIPERVYGGKVAEGEKGVENPIKRLNFFKRKKRFKIEPATVITGNNGIGKTTLINALCAGLGLDDEYFSRESTRSSSHGHFGVDQAVRTFGLLTLPEEYDSVYRFAGDASRRRALALDTMEDLAITMAKGSHGEINLHKFHSMVLKPSQKDLLANKSVVVALDEPEAGLSLENVFRFMGLIKNACETACQLSLVGHRLLFIVSTQHPLIWRAALDGAALWLDLGGWEKENPFSMFDDLIGSEDGKERIRLYHLT